jgi:hypothetical protein
MFCIRSLSLNDLCDFENKDTCRWVNVNEADDFDWKMQVGPTETFGTGPSADHTLQTKDGTYVYIEASEPAQEGWRASLLSEPMSDRQAGCIHFWYHMHGEQIGSLRVSLVENFSNTSSLLWELGKPLEDKWYQGLAPFSSGQLHQITFDGIRGAGDSGDIGLDDILISRTNCAIQPADADPRKMLAFKLFDCNFEADFCNWSNESAANTQFNWTLRLNSKAYEGPTPTGALSTDGYIYIQGTYPVVHNKGDRCRIKSKTIPKPNDDGYCIRFYYYMHGRNTGRLELYALEKSTDGARTLWTKDGDQGGTTSWKRAFFHIDPMDFAEDLIFAFDGVIGNGYEGDIGLDEITIRPGYCPSSSRLCDFEINWCGWTNEPSVINWKRANNLLAANASANVPNYDHTTHSQVGHFVYVDLDEIDNDGYIARLVSATYAGGAAECFRFWYHLRGKSIGGLRVALRQDEQEDITLWYKSGDLGDRWRLGQVTVRANSEHRVVVQGESGQAYDGSIALDDIEVVNGECSPVGSCDFETGFCGFYNTQEPNDDDFDWQRGRGLGSDLAGPIIDVTTKTTRGYYAFANARPPVQQGDRAWLISEILLTPTPACLTWFTFIYNYVDVTITNLTVYVRTRDRQDPIMPVWYTKPNSAKGVWLRSSVTLPIMPDYFDVIFEATVNAPFNGDVAIDDISVAEGGTCDYFKLTTTTTPIPSTLPSYLVSCDFEQDLCGWTTTMSKEKKPIATDMARQWSRQVGRNGKYGSIPLYDHTNKNSIGYFAYLNLKTPTGDETSGFVGLQTTTVSLSDDQEACLEFWYQLSGPSVSEFMVSMTGDLEDDVDLWKRNTNEHNEWEQVFVRVPPRLRNLKQFVFKANVSADLDGYVALDDVKLGKSGCPAQSTCDFETSTCNYINDVTADFKWVKAVAADLTDHTYQTNHGFSMVAQGTSATNGTKARLISPTYKEQSGGVCVTWWYRIYGTKPATLNLYRRENFKLNRDPLWSLGYNNKNSDGWRVGSVTVNSLYDFQVSSHLILRVILNKQKAYKSDTIFSPPQITNFFRIH